MEYQNSFNATGILGEALARHESCRLIEIAPKEPAVERSQRDLELLGLDEHDISFLSAKGAFELPLDQAWYTLPMSELLTCDMADLA